MFHFIFRAPDRIFNNWHIKLARMLGAYLLSTGTCSHQRQFLRVQLPRFWDASNVAFTTHLKFRCRGKEGFLRISAMAAIRGEQVV
jgi:hypothetical protein